MIKKTMKTITLTLCFLIIFFDCNCRTPYDVEYDFLNLSFTNSDATTMKDGYIYYLNFKINELGASSVTIDSVSISINKDRVVLATYDYIPTQVFPSNYIPVNHSLSSIDIIIKHISNVFGDSATVTIKGTNNQNKNVSVSLTTTFPDLAQYPTINLFEINTTSVKIDEIAIIKWRVSNATKVYIEINQQRVYDNLASSGALEVTPSDSGYKKNEYILYAIKNNITIYSQILDISIKWFKPIKKGQLIAHALGGLYDSKYSNSLEAFNKNYTEGKRWFEVDLYLLKDKNLICFHNGLETIIGLNKSIDEISTEEFLKLKYNKKYTLLTFRQLLELIEEKKDAFLVIDIKKWTEENIQIMTNEINEINPELMKKIIPQIYNPNDINYILDTELEYGRFYSLIFTTYNVTMTICDTDCRFQFLEDYEIPIITMPTWDSNHMNKEFINKLHKIGKYVFTHSINKQEDIDFYYSIGVDGFYTSFYIED